LSWMNLWQFRWRNWRLDIFVSAYPSSHTCAKITLTSSTVFHSGSSLTLVYARPSSRFVEYMMTI
jgi:hypothetical protein